MQESFGAIRDIILNSNQEKHSGYFFNSIKKLYDADAQNSFINQSPRFFIETAGIIIIILICSYVAITTQNQTALLPTIGVMILAAQKIIPLMQQVYSNINVIVSNSGQISDLKSFLNPNKNKFLFNKFEEKLNFNEIKTEIKTFFTINIFFLICKL